ncbi:MAG: UbiA family prenyltransferase [Chloroflexota bacterium]|nr:UbiA family prenyltransferase [Chloroflexota bacterium]
MSSERALHYRRPWWGRLHGYLALARVSNSPTVVSNVLAGAALGGALRPDGVVVALAVAMVLFYTAGMYLNDLCDYAIDVRERPGRPLPSGSVSRSAAGVGVVAFFAVGSALLWLVETVPFGTGLLLIGVIVVYDLWHKTNPLSPLLMAAARALVYVTAFTAFASMLSRSLIAWASLLFLYVVGLTYIAKTETGPRLTGYWPAVLLFLPAIAFAAETPDIRTLPLLLLFAGWVAYSVSFVYRAGHRSVGRAIGYLIAGIALLDALALAVAGSGIGVVLALVAFGSTLFFQRYIRGT